MSSYQHDMIWDHGLGEYRQMSEGERERKRIHDLAASQHAGSTPVRVERRAQVMSAGERKLREMLATHVAGASLYRDDGELQDNSVHPFIDFLRDSPKQIEAKLIERNRVALEASLKATEFVKDVNDDFNNRLDP